MASDIDEMFDGEMEEPVRSTSSAPPCPSFCQLFECVLVEHGRRCGLACENLDMTKGMICDLCQHDCNKQRKMVLLELDYFNKVRARKEDDSRTKIQDLLDEYNHKEMKYKEMKEAYYKIPSWQFWAKRPIISEANFLKYDIQMYRKIMDTLGIEYKVRVQFED